jgi:tetratricopeptide (TPR) repeat protein
MDSTVAHASPLLIDADVERLRRLQAEGRHDQAVDEVAALLRDQPDHRDLLLILAVSQRHLRRIADSLATLERLEQVQPRFSRLHQERGLCHVALKDAPRAIESLLVAVNLNAALPASWRMLEGLYRLTGAADHAATAQAHVETLGRLPPEVLIASSLFYDGDLAPAEVMVRRFLLSRGDHPEAMRLLARIAVAREVLDEAELLLEAVLDLAPDYRAARYDYADCLLKRHKHAQARDQVERLLGLAPDDRQYRALAATIAVGLGEHEKAIALYRAMLAERPDDADVNLWLGHALKTVGRVPEAIDAYRAAAAARPDFGDAYWSLANLKTYRFLDAEIAQMAAAEAAPTTALVDRYHLCFALGKAFEDRDEVEESWRHYERANALRRSESRYRPEIVETNTRLQIEVCTADFFAARRGWGSPAPDPIFILGLPRAGSTLIEQILASHSQVEGTQELADIQRMVLGLQGPDPDLDHPLYPGALSDLTREQVLSLGEKYLADTRVYRSGRPLFIDKMPNNFRHIGLIHLILPKARIIDARRDPMSCCFSNLKQLYAQGQDFAYGVELIARYYRTYLDLMRHWDEVLPGRVLRVQHEDVVADLEASVRRLLTYCDLEFEPACVAFHATKRSVRTPSSEQVRRPINRDGLDQWRRFEPWLGPLETALGDALVRYRD